MIKMFFYDILAFTHEIGPLFMVVILAVNDSEKGAEQQIHYSENYKKMNNYPATTNNKTVNKGILIF